MGFLRPFGKHLFWEGVSGEPQRTIPPAIQWTWIWPTPAMHCRPQTLPQSNILYSFFTYYYRVSWAICQVEYSLFSKNSLWSCNRYTTCPSNVSKFIHFKLNIASMTLPKGNVKSKMHFFGNYLRACEPVEYLHQFALAHSSNASTVPSRLVHLLQ